MNCCNGQMKDKVMLRAIFDLLATPGLGITVGDLMILLTKKRKDEDKSSDIAQAFCFLGVDDKGRMPTGKFIEYMQYNGYKYTDEQIAVVLKEADPKNSGYIDVNKFANIITGSGSKPSKKNKPKK